MLSEDILLKIFDFYRLESSMPLRIPWEVHESSTALRTSAEHGDIQYYLDLRILCEYGAPIDNILGTWPTLPLVVGFLQVGNQN
jgi:hypothetical protein